MEFKKKSPMARGQTPNSNHDGLFYLIYRVFFLGMTSHWLGFSLQNDL